MANEEQKPLKVKELRKLVAEAAGITNEQATIAIDTLTNTIISQVVSDVGQFTLPGICKITRVTKPAKPAYEKINPFNKQPMTVAAKPASSVVKFRVLKNFKDVVSTKV